MFLRLLQRLFARVVPRTQIEGLAALNLVNPAREVQVGLRIGGVGQHHEKDGRDTFAEALAHGFVADIVLPFPAAVGAGEVMGREHGEKNLRLAQAALNLLPPIIHAGNLLRVEKHAQVAPGECAEGGFDLRFEAGHLPALIVEPRITDEQMVGAWFFPVSFLRATNDAMFFPPLALRRKDDYTLYSFVSVRVELM